MAVRRRIYAVMSYKHGDAWTLTFSWMLTVMVLANVAAVILESIPELHERYAREFHLFEVFSVGFFPSNTSCAFGLRPKITVTQDIKPPQAAGWAMC